MEVTPGDCTQAVWTVVSMVTHAHKKKPLLSFFWNDIQPEPPPTPPLTSKTAQTCEISHTNVLNVTRFGP